MARATELGQTGLQGWREGRGRNRPASRKTRSSRRGQVRAMIGAAFFVLAVVYVLKTIAAATRQAQRG
jgi:hypothetical protein